MPVCYGAVQAMFKDSAFDQPLTAWVVSQTRDNRVSFEPPMHVRRHPCRRSEGLERGG